MWGTLIGLIERWWRDRPHKGFLGALLRLRNAMHSCQEAFVTYSAAEAADLPTKQREDAAVRWARALELLFEQLRGLDKVMEIFSPELHKALTTYGGDEQTQLWEVMDWHDALARELGTGPGLRSSTYLGLQHVELEGSFGDALSELDKFISSNFKPEEIYQAQQESALRSWLPGHPDQ